MFYTDYFLIILVILVILAIQVITIFLEITIAPYQCCQSYLKFLKTCSKVAIKISSREQQLESAFHSGNSTETALSDPLTKFSLKWTMMNSQN